MVFYLLLFFIVVKASIASKKGTYDNDAWVASSLSVLKKLELVGIRVECTGLENLQKIDGPVLIIGNHMSMMETLVLPGFIQPIRDITFVVKESLLDYPIFKHVMRSRNPIAVTRSNPRQDLKTVLGEGLDRIEQNISVVVFPQTTRAHDFDPKQMSTIGVKLAKKAGVPVVPVALKTDCWQNGRWFKDFGRIDTRKKACFSFGEPLYIEGKGDEEHQKVNAFIQSELTRWAGEENG